MPLNLKAILKDVRNTELVLTNPYRKWLMAHGDDPYPNWVVDIIEAELRKKPRYRPGTFSASSSGQCWRKQELDFLGMPSGDTIDPQLQNIFSDGKWRHLRWQANLLSAGLISRIEVPLRWRTMQAYGTMDGAGEVPDDHPRTILRGLEFGFELKGVNPWDYAKAVKRDDQTKEAHKRQVHRYFVMSGLDLFITVYENKACVPESTRCLTKRGWTNHSDLREDDFIMTYNLERDCMEWEPYQGKAVYESDGEPLWRVGNKHQSFLCTREHTWPVRDQQGRMSFRRTDQLNSNCWVPFIAPYESTKPTVGVETAEWLGWFAADGTITKTKWPSYVIQVKRRRKIDSLRHIAMLTESGPWDGYYAFRVTKGPELDRVRALLPSKAALPGLVATMSTDELEAFLQGAYGGDGSWSSTGAGVQFTQNDGSVKEAVQIAHTLLGQRFNINEDKLSAYPGTRRWMRTYTPIMVPKYKRVWCPKTTNGYWLMEQDGKAVLTGNTNEWYEWVEFPDQNYMQESIDELKHMNEQMHKQKLDPMLPECRVQTGPVWDGCPYGGDPKGSCYRSGEWPRMRKKKGKP